MIMINCVLSHPIERIRGGKICVTVTCTFKTNGENLEVSGFGLSDGDDEDSISKAYDAAVDSCRTTAQSINSSNNKINPTAMADLVKELVANPASEMRTEMLAKGTKEGRDRKWFDSLDAPPPPDQLRRLRDLFETVGMEPIEMGNLTQVEAFALEKALAKQAKVYAVSEDLAIMKGSI